MRFRAVLSLPRPAAAEKANGACFRGFKRRFAGATAAACAVAALGVSVMLSGCSSSGNSKISVGAIAFTDVNGTAQKALTSLTVNTGTYLEVQVNGDKSQLGADWTVYCGSQLPPGTPLPPGTTVDTSCGTFTPVHTNSGPVPSYATSGSGYVTLYTAPASPPKAGVVTLYATSTSNPGAFSSVTLSILGLPISIGFAPAPPATLAVGGSVSLNAVLTNDYVAKGANWTVTCGSGSCGSFSAAHTASGTATTYTAPSAVPAGSTVTVTATSVSDPTKSISASITILPVSVSVAPATLSVGTGATSLLNAIVTNDAANAGVDWTLTCASAGACGSITAHTGSGIAATYSAPSSVPNGGSVTITATSTSSHAASSSAVATVTASQPAVIRGLVRAGSQPVAGAEVSLYATGGSGYKSASVPLATRSGSEPESTPAEAAITGDDGSFRLTRETACPAADSQIYLVARGGNAGGGTNPNLALILPLGPCSGYASSTPVFVNEVTTVAAAYALSAFMRDGEHIGTTSDNRAGLAEAFATVTDLVDAATGEARTLTRAGTGTVPYAEINTLADVLHGCALTAGGRAGDGSPCGDLFALVDGLSVPMPGAPRDRVADTLQSALLFAREAGTVLAGEDANLLYQIAVTGAADAGAFRPMLAESPSDWSFELRYAKTPNQLRQSGPDASGNLWKLDASTGDEIESIGAGVPAAEAAGSLRQFEDSGTNQEIYK